MSPQYLGVVVCTISLSQKVEGEVNSVSAFRSKSPLCRRCPYRATNDFSQFVIQHNHGVLITYNMGHELLGRAHFADTWWSIGQVP